MSDLVVIPSLFWRPLLTEYPRHWTTDTTDAAPRRAVSIPPSSNNKCEKSLTVTIECNFTLICYNYEAGVKILAS